MKKKIKLQWKIGGYLLAFAAVVIAVIFVFQSMLLQPMYEQSRKESVMLVSDAIVSMIRNGEMDDPENYEQELMRNTAENDVCIQIFEMDDSRWRITQTDSGGCAFLRMRPEEIYSEITKAENTSDKSVFSDAKMDVKLPEAQAVRNITYTRVVDGDDGKVAVMVTAGISPINATTDTLRTQMLYISLIMLVLIGGLVLLLNRKIARPITNITESAKALSRGEYEETADHTAYEEVRELNDTLVQAAADIQQADKARRDLIANVSHDLRTPLTMISGYGEMMLDLPEEKTDENIRVIIDESRRLNALVNDLLDLSKLEEDRIELHPECFSMKDLIAEQMRKYDVYRLQDGYVIEAELDGDAWVYADQSRMEQVFNNFMTNAVHYSGTDKYIRVSMKASENTVRVAVTDHGEGIDPADKDRIWDRYYKVDKTHTRPVSGSGIGLSICRRILELHHASYGVDSKKGEGSCFWYELPLQKKDSEEAKR